MDRDTCVARMQQKLGFRTTLATACIAALQDTQDELERSSTLPWWILAEDVVFPITPSVPVSATPQQYALPTGFIRESDNQDGNLRYQQQVPGPQIFIQKMDYTAAEQFFFSQRKVWWDGSEIIVQSIAQAPVAGLPKIYVLRENVVRIYPGPDRNLNLLWTFYQKDTSLLSGNVTNGWTANAPWLLIGRAGLLVAGDIRDADAYSAFNVILDGTGKKQGAEQEYLASIYSREVAGRNYSMGSRL